MQDFGLLLSFVIRLTSSFSRSLDSQLKLLLCPFDVQHWEQDLRIFFVIKLSIRLQQARYHRKKEAVTL